jgi:alkanesulfonate monooxygenase SsuD/methylene tetrahydromethanopterin reductase-like flavin-dependent oxidoreductase (luciferase family)
MKVDVQLSQSVIGAAKRAQELEALGVDGVFSFENAHDLFFPLVVAAPVCGLDLMTNVAIAFPRSPVHLANAAYDLQLLSEGRFRLGLGSQVKAHVEKRFGARWGKPVAHMRESTARRPRTGPCSMCTAGASSSRSSTASPSRATGRRWGA